MIMRSIPARIPSQTSQEASLALAYSALRGNTLSTSPTAHVPLKLIHFYDLCQALLRCPAMQIMPLRQGYLLADSLDLDFASGHTGKIYFFLTCRTASTG